VCQKYGLRIIPALYRKRKKAIETSEKSKLISSDIG
jgi:hypothetical protein